MQNNFRVRASFLTGWQIANIALKEPKATPLLCVDQSFDFVEVLRMPGGEIVEADHTLIEFEQCFKEVGTDEPGNTSNQPGFRDGAQLDLQ